MSKWEEGLDIEEPLAFGKEQTFIISCFALFSFPLNTNKPLHLLWKAKPITPLLFQTPLKGVLPTPWLGTVDSVKNRMNFYSLSSWERDLTSLSFSLPICEKICYEY